MWISVLVFNPSEREDALDTRCLMQRSSIVEDIINRHLAREKVKIPGVRKITITLTLEEGRNDIFGPIKGMSPVVNITKTYDFKNFASLSDGQQKETVLFLIAEGLRDASNKFGWDPSPFEAAFSIVREAEYTHIYEEWKPKTSRDKKHQAAVTVEMGMETAAISIVFFAAGAVIRKVPLIAVRPGRFFVKPLMGQAKWLTPTDFVLTDKGKEIHFIASLAKDHPEIKFTPQDRDADAVIDDLLILAATTPVAQAVGLLQEKLRRSI